MIIVTRMTSLENDC